MKSYVIWWDAPEAKDVATVLRKKFHRVQIRSPQRFTEIEACDVIVLESLEANTHIIAAYAAAGVTAIDAASVYEGAQPSAPSAPSAETQEPTKTEDDGAADTGTDEPAATPASVPSFAPPVPAPGSPDFTLMSDDELRAWIVEAGAPHGIKPHSRAGRERLLQQAALLSAPDTTAKAS